MHALRNDHAAVVFTLESLAIRLRRKVPLEEWKTKFEGMIKVLLEHFTIEEKNYSPGGKFPPPGNAANHP